MRVKTDTLSRGLPMTCRFPDSRTNARPQSATMAARTPIRSAASSMCGTAKSAPNCPPVAHKRSTSVAPRSRTAMTARCPSILSFSAGWRSSTAPCPSASRAPASPRESMSPTTRSGTIPASSAYRAPPSAAATRSARPAAARSISGESAAPLKKTAARTSRDRGLLVARLAGGRLRPFEGAQQHHHDHERDGEARDQVRRGVEGGVPTLRRVGGKEHHAGEEVAQKAGQDGDDGAKDRAPNGGPEKAGETQGAEGQGVIEKDLDG